MNRGRDRSCRSCCGALDAAGVQVLTAEVKRPTLDDVFLALTGRSLRESDIRNLPAAA